MGEHRKIVGINGAPLGGPTLEEQEARKRYVNDLMNAVMGCFPQPTQPADLLTVGVNVLQAFVFSSGPPEQFGQRFEHMMTLLQSAIQNSLADQAVSAQVAAKLRADGLLS